MSYPDTVGALAGDAEQLEQVYQVALKAGETEAFKQAIDANYTSAPNNLLYAAWFYRLKSAAAQATGYVVAWGWVIPLAVLNGLLFWWLSDDRFMITIERFWGADRNLVPTLVLVAASLSAVFILIYLTAVGRKRWGLAAVIGILLLAADAYVLLTYPQTGPAPFQEQYLNLMAMHLTLLAWAGVGIFLMARHRDPVSRFRFLIKSLEVFILGGLFIIAGGLFSGITFGLFDALNVDFPDLVQRLFIAGGAGLIPVVATAVIYNPTVPPGEQAFDEGLSKLVALLMRILLPLTLLVLLVYLAFIPFNFRAPFEKRDVLIIYNGMLFAVVVLLVGATPVSLTGISPRLARWLRLGIIAVAVLALIISLYALSAIVYRTVLDRPTPNRLTFIGWNIINIGLLAAVLLFQTRTRDGQWLQQLYRAYSLGTVAYVAWTLVVILAIPWLFGIDQGEVGALPRSVQEIVSEEPPPILLKCSGSPHIYLLDRGEKRWIRDIATFNDRGYVWRDVQLIPCNHLRSVPDGEPIPADAGPPPQP
jgi:hypothetical protein